MKRWYTKELIIEEIDKDLKPLNRVLSEAYNRRSNLSDSWINNNTRKDIDKYITLIVQRVNQLEKFKEMVKRLRK